MATPSFLVILIGLLLITGFFIPGCTEKVSHDGPLDPDSSPDPENLSPEPPQPAAPEDDLVSGTGTITYIDLEGGFFGILSADGQSLLPNVLPGEYKIDGLSVRYTARQDPGRMSVMMWGTPVTIISIERI